MTFKEIHTMSASSSSVARVPLVDRTAATGPVRTVLDQIHGAFGATPNMFRAVANSPAALQSMWAAFGALGGGVVGAALGEQIAVAVANRNACDYCLAAHTALGRKAGVSGDDLAAAQSGESADPRTAAVLRFALKLVNERGQVDATDRIIYNSTTGAIYYDADGSGSGAAIQFAILTGAPSLLFDDFLIV